MAKSKERKKKQDNWECWNVSYDVLFAWFNIQTKILYYLGVYVQGEWQKFHSLLAL